MSISLASRSSLNGNRGEPNASGKQQQSRNSTINCTEGTHLVSMLDQNAYEGQKDGYQTVTMCTISPRQPQFKPMFAYEEDENGVRKPSAKQWLEPTMVMGRRTQTNQSDLHVQGSSMTALQTRPYVLSQRETTPTLRSQLNNNLNFSSGSNFLAPPQVKIQQRPPKGPNNPTYQSSNSASCLGAPQIIMNSYASTKPTAQPQQPLYMMQHLQPQSMKSDSSFITSDRQRGALNAGNSMVMRAHHPQQNLRALQTQQLHQLQPFQIDSNILNSKATAGNEKETSSLSNPIQIYQRHRNDSTPVLTDYEITEKKPDMQEEEKQPDQMRQPTAGFKFTDLTAFESDCTSQIPTPGIHRVPSEEEQVLSLQPYLLSNARSLVTSVSRLSELISPKSTEQPLSAKLEAIKVASAYNDNDRDRFEKRLANMQQELLKTSRVIEHHKKRQTEVAQQWQAPLDCNASFNEPLYQQELSQTWRPPRSFSATSSHHTLPQQQPYSEQVHVIPRNSRYSLARGHSAGIAHSIRQTPESAQDCHRLYTTQMLKSGRSGRKIIEPRSVSNFEKPSGPQKDENHGFGSRHELQKQRAVKNHDNSKCDQKISYSRTSLDELQFMKEVGKIKEEEEKPQNNLQNKSSRQSPFNVHDLITQRSRSHGSRHRNDRYDRNGRFEHGAERQIEEMSSVGRPEQNDNFCDSVSMIKMAPRPDSSSLHNSLAQQMNRTTLNYPMFSPTTNLQEQNISLRMRLDQLNELLSTQKRVSEELQTINQNREKASRFNDDPSQHPTSLEPTGQDTCVDSWRLSKSQSQTSTNNAATVTMSAPVNMVINEYSDELNQRNPGLSNYHMQEMNIVTDAQVDQDQDQPYEQTPEVWEEEEDEDKQEYYLSEDEQRNSTDELVDLLSRIGIAERHLWKFKEQEIGLYDLFLLTKEDLIELELPIAARNRIIVFQQHYGEENGNSVSKIDVMEFENIMRQLARSDTLNLQQSRKFTSQTQTQQKFQPVGNSQFLSGSVCQISNIEPMKKEQIETLDHWRPRTALDTEDNVRNPDGIEYLESHSQNGMQSQQRPGAQTQILSGELAIDENSLSEMQFEARHNSDNKMSEAQSEMTQPQIITSHLDDNINSRKKSPFIMRIPQRSSSVDVVLPQQSQASQDSQPHNVFSNKYMQSKHNGTKHKRRTTTTINTLSTSQVAPSHKSVAQRDKKKQSKSPTLQQNNEQTQKRLLAKQLYKELKKILLSGGSIGDDLSVHSQKWGSVGTDSVHSFVIEKVCRKVSERSFKASSKSNHKNVDREFFIKKELKRAVRRIFRAGGAIRQREQSQNSISQQQNRSRNGSVENNRKIESRQTISRHHRGTSWSKQQQHHCQDSGSMQVNVPLLAQQVALQPDRLCQPFNSTQQLRSKSKSKPMLHRPVLLTQQTVEPATLSALASAKAAARLRHMASSSVKERTINDKDRSEPMLTFNNFEDGNEEQEVITTRSDEEESDEEQYDQGTAADQSRKTELYHQPHQYERLHAQTYSFGSDQPNPYNQTCNGEVTSTALDKRDHLVDQLRELHEVTRNVAITRAAPVRETRCITAKEEVVQAHSTPNAAFFAAHYNLPGGRPQSNSSTQHPTDKKYSNQMNAWQVYSDSNQRRQENISIKKPQTMATASALTRKQTCSLGIKEENYSLSESCQETERFLPTTLEVSMRNKKLLEQAKRDIAHINHKAAEFKKKLHHAKLAMNGAVQNMHQKDSQPSTIGHQQSINTELNDQTKSTVKL